MAGSGFNQRWLGKIAASQIWLGPKGQTAKITASASDLNTLAGWSTGQQNLNGTTLGGGPGSTISSVGITQLLTTALGMFLLADPVPGATKVISVTSGSTGWGISLKTTSAVILGGSTTNGANSLTNTIKSTVSLVVTEFELIGISTAAYLFCGMYPSTLGHLAFSSAS